MMVGLRSEAELTPALALELFEPHRLPVGHVEHTTHRSDPLDNRGAERIETPSRVPDSAMVSRIHDRKAVEQNHRVRLHRCRPRCQSPVALAVFSKFQQESRL
jgi:hypothetical protein